MNDLSTAGLNTAGKPGMFRSQVSRRVLVSFYLATLATFGIVTWFVDSYWPAIPIGIFYAASFLLLLKSTRSITGVATESLDERQVTIRNAGFRNSYWLGVAAAFAGGIFIGEISDWDTAFELGLIMAVWGVVSGLPPMIVAWNMPDEAGDEEE